MPLTKKQIAPFDPFDPFDYSNAFPAGIVLSEQDGCVLCPHIDKVGRSHMHIPKDMKVGEVSDGYHTFDELYEHRCLLFLGLAALTDKRTEPYSCAWKSRKHSDGSSLEGWFIAGVILPIGATTYHLPDRLWDIAWIPEKDSAPEWDGHDSKEVLSRLANWLAI